MNNLVNCISTICDLLNVLKERDKKPIKEMVILMVVFDLIDMILEDHGMSSCSLYVDMCEIRSILDDNNVDIVEISDYISNYLLIKFRERI